MTVLNLRSAKRHRLEDDDGLPNLQWVHVFFGLFHLRMAIMNLVYVLWRAPESEDFAHLNAIIERLHKHGFSNDKKITNFKATEDLMVTIYKSYITDGLWIRSKRRSLTGIIRTRTNAPTGGPQRPHGPPCRKRTAQYPIRNLSGDSGPYHIQVTEWQGRRA